MRSQRTTKAVSYTHLDVYKRQLAALIIICKHWHAEHWQQSCRKQHTASSPWQKELLICRLARSSAAKCDALLLTRHMQNEWHRTLCLAAYHARKNSNTSHQPVSYTHLDVYKRQITPFVNKIYWRRWFCSASLQCMEPNFSIDYKSLYEQSLLRLTALEQQLQQLRKMIFGSRHERFIPSDRNLSLIHI